MKIDGERVAVITGASRGLGAGLAQAMSESGLRVGLCARTPPALPDGATSEIALCRAVDVTDAASVETFADEVASTLGPIDLWINNAGVLEPIAPVRECDGDEFRRHLEVNVLGVFHGSRAFVRHRREAGPGGVLINISSGAAQTAYAGWGAYCSGKAAVERLTEVISIEEQQAGLRAYAVAPGVVDTGMQQAIREASAEAFPAVEKFHQLKQHGHYNTPSFIASRLLEIAFDVDHRPDSVVYRLPNEWET